MRSRYAFVVLALLFGAASALAAKLPGKITFKYVLEESCTFGAPGTFTSDQDIVQPAGIGFTHVSGVITFDANSATASDEHEALFQTPPSFDFSKEPGTPQGVYPVLLFSGRCTRFFRLADDLSFTTDGGVCTAVGLNGPTSGVTSTIDVASITGQFSLDLQSFVAANVQLALEQGVDSNGNRFERYCSNTMQGVRIPEK